jgi:hypothetical protein
MENLDLYKNRDFQKLSKCNLKTPIDKNGNTIVHLMAKNLDKEAFERIYDYNQYAFDSDVINCINNNSKTPLQLVYESNGTNLNEMINYLIDSLGADPDICASDNFVIISDKENRGLLYMNEKYDKLNQNIMENIRKLSEMVKNSDIVSSQKNSDKITFLRKLIEKYNQMGSYQGRRTIQDSDRSSNYMKNDAYIRADVVKNKPETDSDIVNNYSGDRRYQNETSRDMNQRLIESGNADSNNIDSNNYTATLDQTDANVRKGDSLWYDDVISRDERPLDKFRGGRRKYTSDYDTSDSISLFPQDRETSDSDWYDDYEQSRQRNPETDELYRSFIKRIMDLLNVDEEAARFYRAALKMDLTLRKPELAKRVNDPEKVRELEKLMKDKETLKKAIDKLDENLIRKTMKEREEAAIKRREEAANKKKKRPRKRSNKSSEMKSETSVTTPATPATPIVEEKKTRKRKTKDVAVEGGYLRSEEIIFSSDY